jgi:TfoX/Sxy family transcriptional regulator of competence genes
MSAKSKDIPADRLAAYEALVATHPGVERKGDTVPYTSVNGHMFSSLDRDGSLSLRLSDADREAFVARYKTPPAVSYGIVRKEYVAVPDALLRKTRELKRWFHASYDHVRSLKPKPTTKKRKK